MQIDRITNIYILLESPIQIVRIIIVYCEYRQYILLESATQIEKCSGSVVECLTRDRGVAVRAAPEALGCVHEQDTL